MKLKTTLLAAILAAFAASTVYAADQQPADNKTGKAESSAAEKNEAKKPLKKHDHAAERGAPASQSAAGKSHRETMDKDMPMHDHTQEKH